MKGRVDLSELNERVSAAKRETLARGETFYPGPSRIDLAAFPPKERWDDWVELDSKAWPRREERRYMLVPTTCFNCESACGLLAYVDRETRQVRKFEGNPEHPGSRGRNCAKGPATLNQITDPDRILYPLRRAGARGEGRWERVSWDEALDDIAARIRAAIVEGRPNAVMYHVGRPGEDGFAERVLASWGVDGHNSHTNICSSSGRAGYHYWMGLDRPSPDHANAKVILLISSHLESGHYFNPHAQRVLEGKAAGAKLIVLDTRLSNTATHADYWLSPMPGSEAAIMLAIASHLIRGRVYDREFVRQYWNWQEYLACEHPHDPQTFEQFELVLDGLYATYTFELAERESGVGAETLREVADVVATAGTRLSSHTWRSATAGNLGGWQVSRCLFLLNALLGAVATEGGTYPNAWNKFVPRPIYTPPHPPEWNDLTWPAEYPLAMNELSFLLPHFLKEGRGTIDVYFTRVYNPVWTNPDGFAWIEALTNEQSIGLHVALTPTWSETAFFADYVLPTGHSSERHDIHSYEQYDGQWVGFRQPVLRAARERLGETITDTREVNPGEVWEENELWLELSWRIDPDGSLGIRRYFESQLRPGEKLTVDEYYGYIFEHSVPGLPERAAAEELTPLEYMRRYGAFEVRKKVGALHAEPVPEDELDDVRVDDLGRVYTRAQKPAGPNIVPLPTLDPDDEGRRLVGIEVDGKIVRGFPTPSGRLEFYSRTLAEWGWEEAAIPTYMASHVHPEQLVARSDGPDLHLPGPCPDPYPFGEREVARGDRAHEPTLASPVRCRAPGRAYRRARPGRDRDRPLRRQGVGHRGDPPRRRRLQPSHGPLEACRRDRAAPVDGDRRSRPRRLALVTHPTRGRRAVFLVRPRHRAHLVDRRRRAPEPHVPRTPRPRFRDALLAPGGPGEQGRTGRRRRRYRRRHRAWLCRLPRMARASPPGTDAFPRRDSPTLLAAAAVEACAGRLPAPRRTATGLLMSELLRALGALAEPPCPQTDRLSELLGLPAAPPRRTGPSCSSSSSPRTPRSTSGRKG